MRSASSAGSADSATPCLYICIYIYIGVLATVAVFASAGCLCWPPLLAAALSRLVQDLAGLRLGGLLRLIQSGSPLWLLATCLFAIRAGLSRGRAGCWLLLKINIRGRTGGPGSRLQWHRSQRAAPDTARRLRSCFFCFGWQNLAVSWAPSAVRHSASADPGLCLRCRASTQSERL